MNKILTVAALTMLGTAGAQSGLQIGQTGVELGLTGGFGGGTGAEAFVHVPEVVGPFGVKVSGSVTSVEGIDPNYEVIPGGAGVSGITVADLVSSGVVTTSGQYVIVGVDGTYRLGQIAPGADTLLYFGGRYGKFSGTVSSTDGRTPPAVTSSNAYGVGGGVQVAYPVASNLSVVGDLGLDQFFKAPITYTQGSATETSKPGDAAYADQDARLNQPGTVFKAKVGVKLKL